MPPREWFRAACTFAGLMSALALLPLPMMSFFAVQRWVVCAAGLITVYVSAKSDRLGILLLSLAAVIFYNPIAPITVDYPYRLGAAAAAVVLFLFSAARVWPAADEEKGSPAA